MASPVPAKSQPLHNFSLPHLKWKNHRSGRSRLVGESSSSSPPHRSPSTPWSESPPLTSNAHVHHHPLPHHLQQSSPYVSRRPSPLHKQSPMLDSESESEQTFAVPIAKPSVKTSKKSTKPIDSSKGTRSNKICIRFRKTNNIKHDVTVIEENHSSTPVANEARSLAAEEEELSPKIWNLRPRRPPMNHKQPTGGLPKVGSSPLPEYRTSHGNTPTKQTEVKSFDHNNPTMSTKRKFSIALNRDEIEEDLFSLTGLKPSRRPKKRPRTVQKQLDAVFPGLWLGSITADSYKVSMQQG